MKKILVFLFLSIFTTFGFAVENTKLYINGQLVYEIYENDIYDKYYDKIYYIKDDKFYTCSEDKEVGTITDNNGIITIDFSNSSYPSYYEFNKSTGFALIEKNTSYYLYISEFSEQNGLILKKTTLHKNEELYDYTLYIYDVFDKQKLLKEITYNAYDKCKEYTIYTYDKQTGNLITEIDYDGNDIIELKYEYDLETKEIISKSYFDEGKIEEQTIYDKNTGNPLERRTYSSQTQYEKREYLQFSSSGYYSLKDNFYLRTDFCSYYTLKQYEEESKDGPRDWNKYYNAYVRKYNFNVKTPGYDLIMKLIDDKYLFYPYSIVLGNYNSKKYYCFDINYENELDLLSCYEIELIEKPIDYRAMNKSGVNKGPFGFDIAMTYEEVKNACNNTEPKHIKDDVYSVQPKITHPLFNYYELYISDTVGLYIIEAESNAIGTNNYGTEVQKKFEDLLYSLEKKYGDFNITNYVRSGYTKKDDNYFIQSIREGGREFYAQWNKYTNNEEYDGLEKITLSIIPDSDLLNIKARIIIQYQFKNYEAAQDNINEVL